MAFQLLKAVAQDEDKTLDSALVAPVLQLPHLAVSSDDLAALEGGVEAFLNVNTPEDLVLAERLLSGATA